MRPKRFIVNRIKDQVPQKGQEELILETAQDVLSKAKMLAWAAKEREKCPVCTKEYTLEDVYGYWASGLDNRLCKKHSHALDIMTFEKEEQEREKNAKNNNT